MRYRIIYFDDRQNDKVPWIEHYTSLEGLVESIVNNRKYSWPWKAQVTNGKSVVEWVDIGIEEILTSARNTASSLEERLTAYQSFLSREQQLYRIDEDEKGG